LDDAATEDTKGYATLKDLLTGESVLTRPIKDDDSMEFDEPSTAYKSGRESNYECDGPHSTSSSMEPSAVPQYLDALGIFKRPRKNPVTEEQVINKAKAIYAALVVVEKACIHVDKLNTEFEAQLSDTQWKALISLHRTLLYVHYDFLLASQHPSSSSILQSVAGK
jgi:hypothetical protein